MQSLRLLPVLLVASLLLGGCRDREITAYRAPKDPVAPAAPLPAASTNELPPGHPPINPGEMLAPGTDSMANTAVPTAGGDGLAWVAPATWAAKPSGPMRKGSFAVKGADGAEADMSITAFPGDTGGLHANLNRWRSQVGLPPASPADLDAAILHLDGRGGLHFDVIEIVGASGSPPTAMLGAITSFQGNSWFFKLMGPAPLVAGQKAAFVDFLHTVKAP